MVVPSGVRTVAQSASPFAIRKWEEARPSEQRRFLVASDSATVVGKNSGTIRTNRLGPFLDVRFGHHTQCGQHIVGQGMENRAPREAELASWQGSV